MKSGKTKPAPFLLAALVASMAAGCDDVGGGCGCGGDDAWTEESCLDHCEAYYADDLEDSPISAVESEIEADDCVCTFLPCDTSACTLFCQESEGLDEGVCQLLECVCLD